jgi:hypothetical protein
MVPELKHADMDGYDIFMMPSPYSLSAAKAEYI